MLLMDRNFNPFANSNKQAHIISGNLPELRYGELAAFSHTSEPLTPTSVLPSFKPGLTVITGIPLAMITMRTSIHGFPLFSMGMGLRLAAFGHRSSAITRWKHPDKKKENNLLNLIIKMSSLFARAIITSTARASSVFLSSFSINLP